MLLSNVVALGEALCGGRRAIVLEIFTIIKNLHAIGVTILLVEQNANLALQSADRGYGLEAGRVILSGNAMDLLKSDRVRQTSLG